MPILTTLLLTAQALGSQALAPQVLSSHVCVATTVAAPGERPGRGTPSFSAAETLDVELRTKIRPVVTGDHTLRLKLYTPRGYLYQTFTVPFRFESPEADEEDARQNPTRVVPGFPRPLRVQTLGGSATRASTSQDQATARLPVAGTSISLGSLFGRWTVVPYLDDTTTAPCGPPLTFEIRE
jgi:hypothetical protein